MTRMTTNPTLMIALGFGALLACTNVVTAAPVVGPTVGPPEGSTTDLFNVGQPTGATIFNASPQAVNGGPSDPLSAFGFSSTFIEPTHVIFSNGPAAGAVEFIHFRTPTPVSLASFDLRLQDDNSPNRSASEFRLFSSPDGIAYTQISGLGGLTDYSSTFGSNPISITDTVNVPNAQYFKLELDRANTVGPRLYELDGTGAGLITSNSQYSLDTTIFNATTNTGGDDAPGLATNFSFSSSVGDSPEDAFGNNDGLIETNTFIFDNGRTIDNGNGILGDGGESVDFIQWDTDEPVVLAGYALNLNPDSGLQKANRAAELVAFYVDGIQVDLFDNEGLGGSIERLFASGRVTGSTFRVELTHTTGQGARLVEIDAIVAVPEPSSFMLLGLAATMLLFPARRYYRRAR